MNKKNPPNPFVTMRPALIIIGIVFVMLSLGQSVDAEHEKKEKANV